MPYSIIPKMSIVRTPTMSANSTAAAPSSPLNLDLIRSRSRHLLYDAVHRPLTPPASGSERPARPPAAHDQLPPTALATVLNFVAALFPSAVTAKMMTAAMSATMSAYSTAVAPRSSRARVRRSLIHVFALTNIRRNILHSLPRCRWLPHRRPARGDGPRQHGLATHL